MDQLSPKSIVMRVSHFVLWVFQAVFYIKDSFFCWLIGRVRRN
ncbi:hypothetical protein Q4S33_15415 [Acinetobacter calcoaceticus]|nr:hypothetical protein Q4S33_15415 [Acinetobacter calcoaceticus]